MSRHVLFVAFLFHFFFNILAADTTPTGFLNHSSSCPVNFSYIKTYPWHTSACQNPYSDGCCPTLHAVIGMGLAKYLKDTSNFLLPDINTSFSCLTTLYGNLAAVSLQPSLVPHCFHDPIQFVNKPPRCAGIQTIQDWNKNVGNFNPMLESSCKGDLTNLTRCNSCVKAGFLVLAELLRLSKNFTTSTDCFYIVVLYAAGIVSDSGPLDTGTVLCIQGIETVNSKMLSKRLVSGLIGGIVCVLLAFGLSMLYCKWANKKRRDALHQEIVSNIRANLSPNLGAKWFDEKELQQATDGFSRKNFIGQGASGVVYRGMLSDGTSVAVKVLNVYMLRDEDFFYEIEIVSKIRHKNLLPLRGYSVTSNGNQDRKRYLVYDFMSNGSLHSYLSSEHTRKQLTWPQRRNIILDVAKGLAYLHYGVKPAIYHRDIKATNVLLDFDMKAKVSDFSIAKQSREGQSIVVTRVAGTHGYLAPEYALYGQLSEKADVYSFGILVLEVISGRKVLSSSNSCFLHISDWAWMQIKSGNGEKVFDEALREEEAKTTMERFVSVGVLCAHVTAAFRPTMVEALNMLEGDIDVPTIPDR